jgi:hypothetical protein
MNNWIAVLIFCLGFSGQAKASPSGPRQATTKAVIQAVVQAIEDEIYVRGYQTKFADIGAPDGPTGHRVPAYIEPSLAQGRGWVIYKLMPYGEVYRMFYVRKDGLVVLHGNPRNGFPPTQPDYLTVYMSDKELCQLKGQWLKTSFVVETEPSAATVSAARARDLKRKEGAK